MSIKIETYHIETGVGRLIRPKTLPFLTKSQLNEFDNIGYSGRNSKGKRMTREQYLNSLNIGEFDVTKTGWDNGNCMEKFFISSAYNK